VKKRLYVKFNALGMVQMFSLKLQALELEQAKSDANPIYTGSCNRRAGDSGSAHGWRRTIFDNTLDGSLTSMGIEIRGSTVAAKISSS
jgi:hypothetical protein